MRKKLLGVDVDLTVVNTLSTWLEWFFEKTGIEVGENHMAQYDLVPVMKKLCQDRGIHGFDPFEYWRGKDIYDHLEPVFGSVEVLDYLVRYDNCELVFISHCVPAHEESKRLFLARHFPKHHFISTNKKGLVNFDVMIDDNLQVIEDCVARRPDACVLRYTELIRGWNKTVPDGAKEMNAWDFASLPWLNSV